MEGRKGGGGEDIEGEEGEGVDWFYELFKSKICIY